MTRLPHILNRFNWMMIDIGRRTRWYRWPWRVRSGRTIVAVRSGLWTDPATWGGVLPRSNDSVVILGQMIDLGPSFVIVSDITADARYPGSAICLRTPASELWCEGTIRMK